MSQTCAVIFDVDGVLVDSYQAHLQSWQQVASENDLQMSEPDFAATFGRTSREIAAELWGISDAERVRSIDERKEAIYRRIVGDDFPAMDGAVELIDALVSERFAIALASSGPPENIELTVDHLGRRDAISAIVSARDVRQGKPDPEVFLKAAERLQVAPERCVVVEDAPAGVQAAERAGIVCVVLLSQGRFARDFASLSPSLMVTSLQELSPSRFRELLSRRHELRDR